MDLLLDGWRTYAKVCINFIHIVRLIIAISRSVLYAQFDKFWAFFRVEIPGFFNVQKG